MRIWWLLISVMLSGCSSDVPASAQLADPEQVTEQLQQQLQQWQGTVYRYGGLDRNGIDCSGFVHLTFRDLFKIDLPRSTDQQAKLGNQVERHQLKPGDLIFFKTGSGKNGLHVGIYDRDDQFIHASTSKGVIRSSLNNDYWQKAYWQARRI
ncbi:NlpC/P60 family protein [Serratia microhaemolytica]|uniref:NlpC/P60 family protein n=1 Tax=Serratia microhaemolytica TaxID=2675110 RepID=UPI000FDD2497|nr:NlpC/P60 family protein [Serratia microhaemolytica]